MNFYGKLKILFIIHDLKKLIKVKILLFTGMIIIFSSIGGFNTSSELHGIIPAFAQDKL
jgi:hypothetical protein